MHGQNHIKFAIYPSQCTLQRVLGKLRQLPLFYLLTVVLTSFHIHTASQWTATVWIWW